MTKDQAKNQLRRGRKLTHSLFLDYEYIYERDGQMYDEDDMALISDLFWSDRNEPKWKLGGWSFYHPKIGTFKPPIYKGSAIRQLTWKEPFGTMMLYGKVETRPWKTDYRGDVLIHCAKAPYSEKSLIEISGEHQIDRIGEWMDIDDLQYLGKAIAIAKLVDCRPMVPGDEDETFVRFSEKLFCHFYEDITPIIPFDLKGQQGWKTLDESFYPKIQLYP